MQCTKWKREKWKRKFQWCDNQKKQRKKNVCNDIISFNSNIIRYARTYNLNIYYQKSSINSLDKRIHRQSVFFTYISNSHSHSHFIPLQPPNITCYFCYFCYRLTIFLLFYLFTFLPFYFFTFKRLFTFTRK